METVGLPIDASVSKQINTRQAKLAQTTITDETLAVFNANTPWLRAASSVNLQESYLKEFPELNLDSAKYTANALAKQMVLQNSITNFTDTDNPVQVAGVYSEGDRFGNSYGFAFDSSYGLKPPPGIESFSVTHLNNGTIRQGDLRIKCFTPTQFNLIIALYARIGYSMLIEWGHSIYYDNQGTYQTNIPYTTVLNSFLQGNKSFEELLNGITDIRKKSDGNYDGFLGRVVNFNFSNTSGVYDVNIKLLTQGSIIESLTISNTTPGKLEDKEGDESKRVFSTLSKAMYNLTVGDANIFIPVGTNPNIYYRPPANIDQKFNDKDYLIIRVNTTGTSEPNYYFKFGYILYLIERYCILKGNKDIPIIRVYNPDGWNSVLIETNPCGCSANPEVCYLPPTEINVDDSVKAVGKDFRSPSSIYLGRLYHLHVNMDFINEILEKYITVKGRLNLFNLIYEITQGIQRSLGNINTLVVSYDEDTNRLSIYDNSRLVSSNTTSNVTPINIGGIVENSQASFIRSAELQSEVPSSIQQLAAIGATANFTNREDVALFNLLNRGSSDRIIGKLKDASFIGEPGENDNSTAGVDAALWQKFADKLYTLTQGLTSDEVLAFMSLHKDLQVVLKRKIVNLGAKNPSKFIPFNLKIEMHGLSGFKLLQEIKVNDNGAGIIPFYLKKNFNFIIKAINEDISEKGWKTTIQTFVVSAEQNGKKYNTPIDFGFTEIVNQSPTAADTTRFPQQFNIERLVLFFSNLEFTPIGIAAAVGNILLESGADPTAENPTTKAFGLAQWLGSGRRKDLQKFVKQSSPRSRGSGIQGDLSKGFLLAGTVRTGIESDFDLQLLFMKSELNQQSYSKTLTEMKKAISLETANLTWLSNYEGVLSTASEKRQERLNYAADILDRIQGNKSQGQSSLSLNHPNITKHKNLSFYSAY
jgi:hypothetical protein